MDNQINIGTLDTLVTILRCEISRNQEGAKVFTFPEFRQVYANVDRRVDEQVNTGNLEQSQFINLTIYKIPELTTRWRVRVKTQTFEITGIDPISRVSPLCTLSLHALD